MRKIWSQIPAPLRWLIGHALNGMVIGCCVVFALIWTDAFGIGRLLGGSGLATALLFFQMALTFGAVSMGVAIMARHDRDS